MESRGSVLDIFHGYSTGVYSQHVLTYSLNDGTLKKAYGKWAPTYQKSYANAHGQPLKFYTANWRVYK